MTTGQVILRPAQEAILRYRRGRMAVSAVPGSGKTFTLSLLAAQLIAAGSGRPAPGAAPVEAALDVDAGQQVLIVTYLNSSVDTFKARIRQRLEAFGLPAQRGFDVRTLHSLALEIVRIAYASLGEPEGPAVLDEGESSHFLDRAVDSWIESHPDFWHAFLEEDSPQLRARWRTITASTARAYIRTAKNERYPPAAIAQALAGHRRRAADVADDLSGDSLLLVEMVNGIYGRYQSILDRQAAFDFDDLIWEAVQLLEERPDLADQLRLRWPYVLEDEAQDSIPLQELLLTQLTGPDGNWVRVGDPNQAITSSFTAAHPRFFNAFIDRPGVVARPLPNSGRSAPLIMDAANTLLDWVVEQHPVPEVRRDTFRQQHILPTPPGDAQPNPDDREAGIRIKVFRHREDEELPRVAELAMNYAAQRPSHTLAILVPTNQIGHTIADILDEHDAGYDSLLRGGGREKEIAAALHALLALLADPLSSRAFVAAHQSLLELGHPAAQPPTGNGDDDARLKRFHALLASVHSPEALLFPRRNGDVAAALPASVATHEDVQAIDALAAFLARIFTLRPLPVDDLTLALADELFAFGGEIHESDLAIAYQIASVLRGWRDQHPEWRLPNLAAELADVARGRRRLPIPSPSEYGFEPAPGRITLATQHGAKGLEWDAVFLVGIDGNWIPNSLDAYFQGVEDFLGADPTAEATAQLRYLMAGDAGVYPDRTATESAHIEVISERLRLLYVGVTRARRFLHISRSRATRQYNRERDAEPTTVMGVLYRFLQRRRSE